MIKAMRMVIKRFEVTFNCEISQAEVTWLMEDFEENQHAVLSASHRVLMIDGFENVYDLISLLANNEFVHDIALMKEVITYEPEFHDEDQYEIQF